MPRKVKGYDVYFTLDAPASILVAAHNEKEAKEIAYDEISKMSRDELVDRLLAAYDFSGPKVKYVEYVYDLKDSKGNYV